jgi:uncharacterized protein (UPF0262 family)
MAQDTLIEIVVDDNTWAGGSEARRREWRLCIDEVLVDGAFSPSPSGAGPLRLLLTVALEALVFDLRDAKGLPLARHALGREILRPSMREYLDICLEMGKQRLGDNSPRLEALDIAKRITHDEAGELVRSLLPSLGPDHATARRIFTLLVTLVFDTTRLSMSHMTRI